MAIAVGLGWAVVWTGPIVATAQRAMMSQTTEGQDAPAGTPEADPMAWDPATENDGGPREGRRRVGWQPDPLRGCRYVG